MSEPGMKLASELDAVTVRLASEDESAVIATNGGVPVFSGSPELLCDCCSFVGSSA